MSLFLALELSEDVLNQVTGLIAANQAALPAKWLPREKLHVTLLFLGSPSGDAVAGFLPKLKPLATRHAPFSLRLESSGTFVTARAPAVLWLGVQGDREPLEALRNDAAKLLAELVPESELERPYSPHLTLARSKDSAGTEALRQKLSAFVSAPFRISELVLIESTQSHYRALHRERLARLGR